MRYLRTSGKLLYNAGMQIAFGKIVDGRMVVDADRPEGDSLTVLLIQGDGTFEADPDIEKMLLEAIAQCERHETTPMAQLLRDLGPSGSE